MSADNWGICPQCIEAWHAKASKSKQEIINAYGKVPIRDWLKVREERIHLKQIESTLREDYDIYINDCGEFFISYEATCEVCGFQHSFKHEEQLELAK